MSGANSHAMGNNIRGLAGASAIGVSMPGNNSSISNTYIEGNSTTGTGINANGQFQQVVDNTIVSNAVNTLQNGIVAGASSANVSITSNSIASVTRAGIELLGFQATVSNNVIQLQVGRPTATLQPVHILNDGAGNQQTVTSNDFLYGWRGTSPGRGPTASSTRRSATIASSGSRAPRWPPAARAS